MFEKATVNPYWNNLQDICKISYFNSTAMLVLECIVIELAFSIYKVYFFLYCSIHLQMYLIINELINETLS